MRHGHRQENNGLPLPPRVVGGPSSRVSTTYQEQIVDVLCKLLNIKPSLFGSKDCLDVNNIHKMLHALGCKNIHIRIRCPYIKVLLGSVLPHAYYPPEIDNSPARSDSLTFPKDMEAKAKLPSFPQPEEQKHPVAFPT